MPTPRYRLAIDLSTAQEHLTEWHPGCELRTCPGEEILPADRKTGIWLKIEVFGPQKIVPEFTYLFRREGV